MVKNIDSVVPIFYDGLTKVDIPIEISQSFEEILTQSLTSNYDMLKVHFKNILPKCVINEIDTSQVEDWDRLDFPKNKVFDENCTLEDLQSIKVKGAVPTSQLDPRVQKALDCVTQNAVSILISPEAVDRMNKDESFYKKVMLDLSKLLYPGVLDDMRSSYTYQYRDVTYKSTTTDACIIATVSADGEVEYLQVVWGNVQRIDGKAPSCDVVLSEKSKNEEKKGEIAEQTVELFFDNIYDIRGSLDLQMGESVSFMMKKNVR